MSHQGEEAENTKEFSTKYIFENLIYNEFREIIRLSYELTKQKNINFYFVYVQSYFSSHKNFKGRSITHMNDQYYLDILSVINELQIPLIDLKLNYLKKIVIPYQYFRLEHTVTLMKMEID